MTDDEALTLRLTVTGAVEPRGRCPILRPWSCSGGVPPASSNCACHHRDDGTPDERGRQPLQSPVIIRRAGPLSRLMTAAETFESCPRRQGTVKERLSRFWHVARQITKRGLPMLSLIEAARVSGQSKSTIWRAVSSGRLSATRTYTGDYQIDPAELHRAFCFGTGEGRATTVSVKRDGTDLERAETALMQAQIDRLFQVGGLIRNELDKGRTPGAVRLTGCAGWSADLPLICRSVAVHVAKVARLTRQMARAQRVFCRQSFVHRCHGWRMSKAIARHP